MPADATAARTEPGRPGRLRDDGDGKDYGDGNGSGAGRGSGGGPAPDGGPVPGTAGPAYDGEGIPDAVSLSERLTALARLIQIGSARGGPEGFSPELLQQAEDLLGRVGDRLRMSAEHTVVILAGGTGSGKSSLFNVLAGADFSPVGVVRPMTRDAHACVWGMEGAGPLLEWLGVHPHNRYARSSALDDGERALAGLLLVDLPDHDSVLAGTSGEVSRLVALADLMVWVLDPQKYADAAVHSRYLVPMAGHSAVITVVLNQADLLTPGQATDCVSDLQRLLDGEGLHDARVLVASAVTGTGIGDLRKLLFEAVTARQAVTERIEADVDALAARFARYAGDSDSPGAGGRSGPVAADAAAHGAEAAAAGAEAAAHGAEAAAHGAEAAAAGQDHGAVGKGSGGGAGEPPGAAEEALAEAFARASGLSGVGRTLQSARELRAVDYIGWPVSWMISRLLWRDPARKMRLGNLWDELRGVSAGPAGAQQAEIDNAITALADDLGLDLPEPWAGRVRSTARSRIDEIPAALGAVVAESLPAQNRVSLWWRLVATWQGLLLGGAVVGVAWLAALIAVGVFHATRHAGTIFSDVTLLPWVALMTVAVLGLGWLTSVGCMSLVVRGARRERRRVEQRSRAGIARVAREMVMMPVNQELAEYTRFCGALAVARGTNGTS